MWAMGEPSGPIEKGIDVHRAAPHGAPVEGRAPLPSSPPAPASCWWGRRRSPRSEQMKVRSSTRATSAGSELHRKLLGRLASSRRVNEPCSTSRLVSRSHSSSEPSHHSMASGWKISAHSSTQALSFSLVGRRGHRLVSRLSSRRCDFGRGTAAAGGSGRVRSRSPGAVVLGEVRRAHVHFGAQPQRRWPDRGRRGRRRPADPGAPSGRPSPECAGRQVVLGQIGVGDDDSVAGHRVVRLDHTLHVGLADGSAAGVHHDGFGHPNPGPAPHHTGSRGPVHAPDCRHR